MTFFPGRCFFNFTTPSIFVRPKYIGESFLRLLSACAENMSTKFNLENVIVRAFFPIILISHNSLRPRGPYFSLQLSLNFLHGDQALTSYLCIAVAETYSPQSSITYRENFGRECLQHTGSYGCKGFCLTLCVRSDYIAITP